MKIFLSYKSEDIEFVKELRTSLIEWGYNTWIDLFDIPKGAYWPDEIDKALNQCDFVLGIISSRSIQSRNVKNEWDWAIVNRKPLILIRYEKCYIPMNYVSINYIDFSSGSKDVWNSLRVELRSLESTLVSPDGHPDDTNVKHGLISTHEYHIDRDCDVQVLDSLKSEGGVTVFIKAPGPVGRNELLHRVSDLATSLGKTVISIDLLNFEKAVFGNQDSFFQQLAYSLVDQMGLDDIDLAKEWNSPLGSTQTLTRIMERFVLPARPKLVLIIDKCELLFDSDTKRVFFPMIRSWHNIRASRSLWRRLDIILTTSTEPYSFIDDLNMSPFNIGVVVELTYFNSTQTKALCQYRNRKISDDDANRVFDWTKGNPYLVNRILEVASQKSQSVGTVLESIEKDWSFLNDHLELLWAQIRNDELTDSLKEMIISGEVGTNNINYSKLKSVGLIMLEKGRVIFTCEIYEKFMKQRMGLYL
jgi:hypothetical protein